PRRRLLADDGEHITPADPHVDELTALRRQYHQARESAIPLEAPLASTGKLVAFQGPASLAHRSDAVFSPPCSEPLTLHPLAVRPGRAARAIHPQPALDHPRSLHSDLRRVPPSYSQATCGRGVHEPLPCLAE
ncbi:MAG: hypothetical protein ACK56I_23215, partial [bacterium]